MHHETDLGHIKNRFEKLIRKTDLKNSWKTDLKNGFGAYKKQI
jgi:hypothetical protein